MFLSQGSLWDWNPFAMITLPQKMTEKLFQQLGRASITYFGRYTKFQTPSMKLNWRMLPRDHGWPRSKVPMTYLLHHSKDLFLFGKFVEGWRTTNKSYWSHPKESTCIDAVTFGVTSQLGILDKVTHGLLNCNLPHTSIYLPRLKGQHMDYWTIICYTKAYWYLCT